MNLLKRSESAGSLIAVMLAIMVCMAMVGIITLVTSTQARLTRRTVDRAAAISFGDAIVESLFDQWRIKMTSVTDATDRRDGITTGSCATLTAPSTSVLPVPPGLSLISAKVYAADPFLNPRMGASDRPIQENGTSSKLRVRLHYLAEVIVQFPGPAGNNRVTVRRAFVRAGRNLFENFFFGATAHTELHPGAPMYVDGKIYASGDAWTAHDDLHLLDEMTFGGTHSLTYRPGDPRATTPNIASNGLANNWNPANPPKLGPEQRLLDTPSSRLDPNFRDDSISNDTDSDGNPDNDGFHEMIEEQAGPAANDPLQLDPATSERLPNNADYRIYVNATNTVSIYKGASATPLGATSPEYQAIKAALVTDRAMRDVRVGDNVRNTVMDVGVIKSAVDTNKIFDSVGGGDGLLLYFRDTSVGTSVTSQIVNSATSASTSVTSSRARGLKLVNGGRLPDIGAGGFTVVSSNPVYIQGDYNSGWTSSANQPPSNTAASYTPPNDAPSPVVSGYNRVTAAVVGDAVNILSNSWNDANSTLGKAGRVASNTTINCAIVAGNVPTTSSSYSGGVENFVRFHETWSGKFYTNYGALALLFASKEANRPWSSADYDPPNRRWYFDTLFLDRNPAGFGVARVYERGLWLTP